MTFSSQEQPLFFRKEFLYETFFTLFVLSLASDNTTSKKYWRDGCMDRPPHLKFLGAVPPVLGLGLRPWN